MGTLTARFWEYISEHPEADGQEIAAALDADYGIIRAYICKYRKAGSLVDVEENGVHRWEINPEKMARPRGRCSATCARSIMRTSRRRSFTQKELRSAR